MSMDFGGGTREKSDTGSSGGSGGGKGGGRRKTIIVKTPGAGSKQYPPDTRCGHCSRRAVGVLVREKRMGGKTYKYGDAMCPSHRDRFKRNYPVDWEERTFERFVDQ